MLFEGAGSSPWPGFSITAAERAMELRSGENYRMLVTTVGKNMMATHPTECSIANRRMEPTAINDEHELQPLGTAWVTQ